MSTEGEAMSTSAPEGEFDAIMIPTGGNRPVMSKPRPYQAATKFIREVSDALERFEGDTTGLADWMLNKMERFGARTAQPMFDMEGNGPSCSWCGMIWPLCGHQHMSEALKDDDESDPAA